MGRYSVRYSRARHGNSTSKHLHVPLKKDEVDTGVHGSDKIRYTHIIHFDPPEPKVLDVQDIDWTGDRENSGWKVVWNNVAHENLLDHRSTLLEPWEFALLLLQSSEVCCVP